MKQDARTTLAKNATHLFEGTVRKHQCLSISKVRGKDPNFFILTHISCVRPKNLQPSHSFKYRGISYFIQRAKETHGGDLHCVIASGGNAALAAACAAHILQVKCTVFIPEGVTKSTLDLLKRESAEVVVTGRFYAEALEAAKQVVATDSNA